MHASEPFQEGIQCFITTPGNKLLHIRTSKICNMYIKFDCLQRTFKAIIFGNFFSSCNLIASQQKSFLYIKTLITINHILVLLYKIQLSHLMILMNLKYFFSECDCNQEIVIRSGKTLCVLVGSSLQVLHYNVHINRT